jgi:hypothetical protein
MLSRIIQKIFHPLPSERLNTRSKAWKAKKPSPVQVLNMIIKTGLLSIL